MQLEKPLVSPRKFPKIKHHTQHGGKNTTQGRSWNVLDLSDWCRSSTPVKVGVTELQLHAARVRALELQVGVYAVVSSEKEFQ